MTTSVATPRPWFWNSYSAIYGGPAAPNGDREPEYAQVIPLPRPTRGDVTTAQGAADARFLVEAVNDYDRLRKIEAAARATVDRWSGGTFTEIGDAIDALRAALD